jgi:hypothetical protein
MAGVKGRSGGSRKNTGGKRLGAGRPPRKQAASTAATGAQYQSAEEYLSAVVSGAEPPNADRVSAARTLIRFQRRPERAPLAGAVPRELARREQTDRERDAAAAWEAKAKVIRGKFGRE